MGTATVSARSTCIWRLRGLTFVWRCAGACTGGKPVAEKYKCGSGDTNHQCVRDDVEGTFADDTCDFTCNKPSKQFHCQGKQCVEKDNCVSTAKNGCFADPDCDGTCE